MASHSTLACISQFKDSYNFADVFQTDIRFHTTYPARSKPNTPQGQLISSCPSNLCGELSIG